MTGDLYDRNLLAWSEQQAALLRRRAAGELVNDAELDWPNIAEEIESVGTEQVHAVRSFLTRALEHDLKVKAWAAIVGRAVLAGGDTPAPRRGCRPVHRSYATADRHGDALWPRVASTARDDEWARPLPVPQACSVTLDELLGDND